MHWVDGQIVFEYVSLFWDYGEVLRVCEVILVPGLAIM